MSQPPGRPHLASQEQGQFSDGVESLGIFDPGAPPPQRPWHPSSLAVCCGSRTDESSWIFEEAGSILFPVHHLSGSGLVMGTLGKSPPLTVAI